MSTHEAPKDRSARPALPTRVGRAEHGSNVFFGYRVEQELVGRETTTSLLILAVTGKRATEEQVRVLDDVATVLSSADPRIWLFKAVRLAAAYGGMLAGMVAGTLCLHRASVGHLTASQAAELLAGLRAELGDDPGTDALERAVAERLRAGRLVGFGVPFRDRDERAVALARRLEQTGRAARPHYRLLSALAPIVKRERGLEPNLGGYLAACFLDLDFAPRDVGPLVFGLGQHAFLANAVEGAAQAPEVLRSLPREFLRDELHSVRRSPRALARR
ncbi:MAG TPA: hypothetical protein VIL20_00725 [Sandaracinaceae bacterium]